MHVSVLPKSTCRACRTPCALVVQEVRQNTSEPGQPAPPLQSPTDPSRPQPEASTIRTPRLFPAALQMAHDPITLVVALDKRGEAAGELYVDDGRSFAFQVGGARPGPVATLTQASSASMWAAALPHC